MSLEKKIEENRRKHARYRKYETVLRRVRLKIFDYEDEGPEKLAKAQRVIAKCKAILRPLWEAQAQAREKAASDKMMRTWE